MTPIEYLIFPLVFLFAWISSFLWHELGHIKSQGILKDGVIYVDRFGLRASCNSYSSISWFYYGGGILSGLVFLLLSFCLVRYTLPIGYIFGMVGITNLVYGIFEGLYIQTMHSKTYILCRYSIYVTCITVMVIIYQVIFGW